MRYIRVAYMCPICNQIHFFDKDSKFSTKCPDCDVEMELIEQKWTSTEAEEKQRLNKINSPTTIVECPYCHSMNTKKISNIAKAGSVTMFGIFSQKVKHQWHCNNCGSDF